MRDPARLQELLREYDRMDRLDGYSRQSRGQRFNYLLRDILRHWDIDAEANILEAGEIDVAFVADGVHYVLEAKWEAEPADIGTIAKLQKRVRQRLEGTRGVIASMAGFTPKALSEIKDGDRLNIVCMSRELIEAMLSGFINPAELFRLLTRAASWRGNPAPGFLSLFVTPDDAMTAVFRAPPEFAAQTKEMRPGAHSRVVLANLPCGRTGIACLEKHQLLITMTSGMKDGRVSFLGGGLAGNVSVFAATDGRSAFAFATATIRLVDLQSFDLAIASEPKRSTRSTIP